ncbi:MAG: DUF5606 domain-containing protein [Muribaculaceae bacterium]|nr:DUF5606 domain-containing protein [Muribaculaceae bacterium]
MIKQILSIAGRPGLFKLVSQGKNMLIVESLLNGKRTAAYARDKVISIGDISIYTVEGDKPLPEVLQSVKDLNEGKQVDINAIDDLRAYFATILPEFDTERVHTSDIRKLLTWYNQLVAAGEDDFSVDEHTESEAE